MPTWAALDGILYPAHISMEQCSSETTAKYKAKIAGSGTLFVDLTAGFGVDAAFISRNFNHAITVERQSHLCEISSANYKLLGYDNIQVVCGDGVEYLHSIKSADLIFIDPARRDEHGSRTYGIADCTPNILPLLDELLEKAERVMVKLSPMLDWRKAVEDIRKVSEVHIVSVDNECKELLLIISKNASPLKLFCANNDSVFECIVDGSTFVSPVCQCESLVFLYEPNASIMKGGCFGAVSARFNIPQIDKNSHLFISDNEVPDFPGRHFTIDRITSMNKRDLKLALYDIEKANITVRNFPMSVSFNHMSLIEIRKVTDRKSLDAFINFHYDLYQGNQYDAPNLYSDELHTLSRDKNAAFDFCEAEYFLAYKDNQLVGRVAGIINNRANEQWNRKSVRFGWIDFIDDMEVSKALLDAVSDWGRQKGMTEIVGPLGFTDMDPEGMLTSGFADG